MTRIETLVKGLWYELNAKEQKLVMDVAEMKELVAKECGHKDYRMGGGSSLERKHTGIAGEYCLAKLLGVDFDLSKPAADISAMRGTDKYDLVWRGYTIDVKTTENGKLLVAKWANGHHPDYYMMMRGPFPRYTYMGCMLGRELMRKERLGLPPYNDDTQVTATLDELVDTIAQQHASLA